MAENSKIEWTDHTFNPWIGCTKVSTGCANCYAEAQNEYRRWNGGTWGVGASRRVTSEANWRQPKQWNRAAQQKGQRYRVFSASLADVFDSEAPKDAQSRLFDLIEETPNLDWLLLTKRPQNAKDFLEARYGAPFFTDGLPANIRLGTSAENQAAFDERVAILLQMPVPNFLSIEPLLGNIDLRLTNPSSKGGVSTAVPAIDWVIVGGESGRGSRPMHPAWALSIRDQCVAAGVPFFFKQWGEWAPSKDHRDHVTGRRNTQTLGFNGKDSSPDACSVTMVRVGKKTAGRLLDGRPWNGLPLS